MSLLFKVAAIVFFAMNISIAHSGNLQSIMSSVKKEMEHLCQNLEHLSTDDSRLCERLKNGLTLLSQPKIQKSADVVLEGLYNDNGSPDDIEFARTLLGVVGDLRGKYQPDELFKMVSCLEKNKSHWQEQCQLFYQDIENSSKLFHPEPDESCTLQGDSLVVVLKPDCTLVNFKVPEKRGKDIGSGASKSAYILYSYGTMNDLVLLKLHGGYAALDNEEKELFDNEISFLNRIKGQKLVGFPEVKYADRSAIIMERLDYDLSAYPEGKVKTQIGLPSWVQISSQLFFAVRALHQDGMVHQDLKPANGMFSSHNRPAKIRAVYLDFGSSFKPFDSCMKGIKIKILGTPGYIAPEMSGVTSLDNTLPTREKCLQVEERLKKADVFAHAGTLYATRHNTEYPPWGEEDCRDENIRSCLDKEIAKLIKTGDSFDNLIAKVINPDPEKRLDIVEFQAEFDKIAKREIFSKLSSKLANLRMDLDAKNARPLAPKFPDYIAFAAVSALSGRYEINVAFQNEDDSVEVKPLEANPFDLSQVESELLDLKLGTMQKGKPAFVSYSLPASVLPPIKQ